MIAVRTPDPLAAERVAARVLTAIWGIGFSSIILFSVDSSSRGRENLVSRFQKNTLDVISIDDDVIELDIIGSCERLILAAVGLCAAASMMVSFISDKSRGYSSAHARGLYGKFGGFFSEIYGNVVYITRLTLKKTIFFDLESAFL